MSMYQYYGSKNQRQVPKLRGICSEKSYCDLLYAWLQCNSERISPISAQRRIQKSKVKWQNIERDFTREVEGQQQKTMGRKTIAKYFDSLKQMGLVYEEQDDEDYYYITLLNTEDAGLIEYHTLEKLINVLQKRSVSIYVYLYSRFCANALEPYIVTMRQVKDFIGISSTTSSNNVFIVDTFDILQRLGLLSYSVVYKDNKSYYQIEWVQNELPQ